MRGGIAGLADLLLEGRRILGVDRYDTKGAAGRQIEIDAVGQDDGNLVLRKDLEGRLGRFGGAGDEIDRLVSNRRESATSLGNLSLSA